MKKKTLTVEEAYHALESLPRVFPDPNEVRSIIDRVQATVWDLNDRKKMCLEIDWWRGWLSAETRITQDKDMPEIPYLIQDAPDDILESVVMGHWWSGFRNRVMMDPLITDWRRKKNGLPKTTPLVH